MKRNILFALFGILVVIQFFPIDKTNPTTDKTKTFEAIAQPNSEVLYIMKKACYDCHSNNTDYPWYTNIAPLSWWIKEHINEGREHVNYSEWGNYSASKQAHKIEETIEVVEEKEMPMLSYWLVHWDAKLTDNERSKLVAFMKKLEKN